MLLGKGACAPQRLAAPVQLRHELNLLRRSEGTLNVGADGDKAVMAKKQAVLGHGLGGGSRKLLRAKGIVWYAGHMIPRKAYKVVYGGTFKNITLTQTNKSKISAGLFGQLAETASITDVAFENVTFTIKGGTRVAGTAYGLLTGILSDGAQLSGVTVTDSKLQIDSDCYFGTDDYTIGLVCGMGTTDIDYTGITCRAVGDAPENVVITVTDSTVTVEIKE